MARSLAAVVLVAALILAIGIAVSEARLQAAFAESREGTRRDLEAIETTTRLIKRVVDLETGERGFLLTGEDRFLEPYDAARVEIPQLLTRIRTLDAAEPARLDDVDAIAATLDEWRRTAGDPELAARRRDGAPTAELIAMVAAGTGKQLIDRARTYTDRLLAAEAHSRDARTAALERSRLGARRTVAASGAMAGLVALGLGLLFSLRMRRGVGHLIGASERIARGDFKTPVPHASAPLDRLAASLGTMSDALADRERQAEALLAVARSDGTADLDTLLAALRRAIGPVLPADAVTLLEMEGDLVHRLATFPTDLLVSGVRRSIDGTAIEAAVKSREPVVVTDVSDEGYSDNALARQLGASCFAVLPLQSGDTIYGALALIMRRPMEFTPSLMRFLRTLARQLSVLVMSFQLKQEASARNRELERANRAKSDFLAMMSHELRTPLNSIIGFSDVLIDGAFGALNERQSRYMRNVNDSGRHLLRLINDLLDMSKIEAGRLEVVIERCAPRILVVDAIAALQPLADQKQIGLEVMTLEAPGAVMADPVRLKQVIYNLLSNAIKFTPAGGLVTVSFAVLSGGQRVRLTVRDSGPGISDADRSKLFMPFSQLENAKHDPRAGTGLGLALTKQLVELMDGTITIDSVPGGGSAFSVELPAAAAVVELTSTAPADAPLVLLVDDDAAARELVQLTLGSHYRLATVATGEEAVTRARALRPDVILLDVFLPGMDGWEVLRALRSDEGTRDTPVVLVTISTDRHTSFALGAVDHLVKPVSSETLLAALARRSLIKRAKHEKVRILVVDDDRRHCELVRAMLEPHGFLVRTELTGQGGVTAARDERFDLMLLDLVMPDLSGVEVVEALRVGGKAPEMPIILLTANQVSASDRARLNGSVAAVLAKAATGPEQLVNEIRRVLNGASAHGEGGA